MPVMNQYDTFHLALFSGKGGVGKTTLSCGFARHWAHQFPHEQILLLSTDPAHSLGDVLQIPIGDQARAIADLPNLQVRALDAQALLQAFRQRYGAVLELLVERGSFVAGDDLSPVWDLSWPGLDELMSILEIQRLLRDREADRIVVDMAPSGHTLNLFRLMDFLEQFLEALDLFQEKHRFMTQRFAGQYAPDEADRFLQEMKQDLAMGRALLQDATRTACMVVAIAEPMSGLESGRLINSLHELQIPVGGLWVNQLLPTDADRSWGQQQMLPKFEAIADPQPVWVVPQQLAEPVGNAALDQLWAQVQPWSQASGAIEAPQAVQWPEKLPPSLPDFVAEGRRLIVVGGKGGVGKTTVAAAIAYHMASQHPEHRVQVISIDPAHSLGDAFGQPLGHEPTLLTHRLSAQELDANRLLDQFREDYLWELAEMMSGDAQTTEFQVAYGPEAWRKIVAQALPGIDEMLALIGVMELLERQEQDLIVLDTAPTGHLLRFLEMPTALAEWLAWIFKLWMKYQDVVGRVELMGRLRTLRQHVMKAQKQLLDPQHTEFVGVVQAQSAIVAEAQRLSQTLSDMGIQQRYLIHNRYQPHQNLSADFPSQTLIRLPFLPNTVTPQAQIQGAATLMF
jgi:arsenite-transporting ATPase